VAKECERMQAELADLDKQVTSRRQRLENPKYVERAPAHVVALDRATLDEMEARAGQLRDKVRSLCGT
jgi:valyl-tRNA synthetase